MKDNEKHSKQTNDNIQRRSDDPAKQEDFYFENGLMVMTESHHLKRGYCCDSNCRHCPYKSK